MQLYYWVGTNQERTSLPESILQAWGRSGHRRIALAFRNQTIFFNSGGL